MGEGEGIGLGGKRWEVTVIDVRSGVVGFELIKESFQKNLEKGGG